MTRTATTKFVATALAVASLGLVSSAQAADPGIAVGEPTPGTGAPTTPAQPVVPTTPAAPEKATAAVAQEEEVDYNSPAYFKSQEAKDRFARYCNMKDAEPSHSDKKFCEDFRKNNTGTTTTTGNPKPTNPTNPTSPTSPTNPTHPEKPYKPGYHKPGYEKPYQASEPSKGSLPFTGLEIWQLGLLGLVLGGGGIGVRRLLAS